MLCLILTGIHVYLGIHVLARGVIFVDLALAQIAALGATVALMFDIEHGTTGAYWISLAFTLGGAVLFSLTRGAEKRKIPQEAIIGITYAVSSALSLLVIEHAAHGGEHIKEILVGNILWVTWPEVMTTLVLYSVVGVIHYLARRQLLLISFQPAEAERQGYSLKRWDLLFYATFGVVITSSVKMAGVLLVFSYLVIPSVIGVLFCESILNRLIVGWLVGFLVSVLGIALSYKADLPTGAALVAFFGLTLAVAGVARVIGARRAL